VNIFWIEGFEAHRSSVGLSQVYDDPETSVDVDVQFFAGRRSGWCIDGLSSVLRIPTHTFPGALANLTLGFGIRVKSFPGILVDISKPIFKLYEGATLRHTIEVQTNGAEFDIKYANQSGAGGTSSRHKSDVWFFVEVKLTFSVLGAVSIFFDKVSEIETTGDFSPQPDRMDLHLDGFFFDDLYLDSQDTPERGSSVVEDLLPAEDTAETDWIEFPAGATDFSTIADELAADDNVGSIQSTSLNNRFFVKFSSPSFAKGASSIAHLMMLLRGRATGAGGPSQVETIIKRLSLATESDAFVNFSEALRNFPVASFTALQAINRTLEPVSGNPWTSEILGDSEWGWEQLT